MAFVPTNQRIAGLDADNVPIMYVEGTHETGDTLPPDHIAQGSWSLNLDDKSVVFFNGDTETWG